MENDISQGGSPISDIVHALQVIHDSRSDNEIRQKASEFLETKKRSHEAAYIGYNLAIESSQPAVVRHYGLSLLEHILRHNWTELNDAQILEVRNRTITLAQHISDQDPVYLRNKIAQLLVELAKKDWAVSWYELDPVLLALWRHSLLHQELVLTVLETLSEDVFVRDDPAAGLRGQDLNSALVEIFTTAATFAGGHSKGRHSLRADDDGWLSRISQWLATDAKIDSKESHSITCTCKALATLKSALAWVMIPAITATHCLESIFSCLVLNNPDVLLAALEALHSLYGRTQLEKSEFLALVSPVYHAENISLLSKLYDESIVDCHDIDPNRYTFSKKFSETIAFIAGHIEDRPASELNSMDLSHLFPFMVRIIQHQSLVVSIPVMHAWVRLLKSSHTGNLESIWSVVGSLLDISSQRIIRYELLPDDSDEPSILFLNEDIDTIPERHAFLGNYRRFCYQIIELVAQRRPQEAISHILAQVNVSLDQIAAETPPLDPAAYRKSSNSLLRLDAQLTVVEAALKGYSRREWNHSKEPPEWEQERSFLDTKIEAWAISLLTERRYDDPLMKQRIIKMAVEYSARALQRNQAFALRVLEHILLTQTIDQPQYPAYSEAVRELQVYATGELRRLALRHADYFATFYDQLESKIQTVLSGSTFDEKAEADMYGTLLIVLQHATNLELATRDERLQGLIGSMLNGWQSEKLDRALSGFEEFCQLLGLDQVGNYLRSKQANAVADWSTVQLDAAGLSIQSHMSEFVSQVPLRITKVALGVTTEKLEADSEPYRIAINIWAPRIQMLLPKVLQLVQYAHRLHDVDSWPNLPTEIQPLISRLLRDRFWQAGISSGSRDDFYSRVTSTKTSLEGFASFVRGKIRLIREACYQILHSMSRLGNHFYGYSGLPGPLSESLIDSTTNLSSHQFSVLLQMIRSMVDACPIAHREQFLPPILSTLFRQLDHKIMTEWGAIELRQAENTGEDSLVLEMKEESILRQLTYTAVNFVAVLLDPLREQHQPSSDQNRSAKHTISKQSHSSLRDSILNSPAILEPLLLFSTHVLTIPDSRSASTITKVLRTVVPAFASLSPSSQPEGSTTVAIREYIASSILKAAITSLNDGYFADLQKEFASLIATIWVAYGCPTHFPAVTHTNTPTPHASDDTDTTNAVTTPSYDRSPLSQTPRSILLSLPAMDHERVDATAVALTATGGVGGHTRQQRALVLDLLDGLRGVRISELGRIGGGTNRTSSSATAAATKASRLQQRYMRTQQHDPGSGGGGNDGGSTGMEEGEGVGIRAATDVGPRGGGSLTDDAPDLGIVGELLG